MNYYKKIPGATLIEVIVVMTITGVVFTLAAWVFLNISSYLNKYSTEEQQSTELTTLIKLIDSDLRKYSKHEFIENELLLYNSENSEEVAYIFYNEGIIRQNELLTDTFKLEINNATIQNIEDNALLTDLSFTIKNGTSSFEFEFSKPFDNREKHQLLYGNQHKGYK